MKIVKLAKNIHHIIFDEQAKMASAIMRFSEWEENRKYKHKIVCKEDIEKDYQKLDIDFVNYFEGFNLSDSQIKDFLKSCKYLYEDEQCFVNKIKPFLKLKCYFIITLETDKDAILHELSHAFYYLYEQYKQKMLWSVEGHPVIKKIKSGLQKYMGYGKGTLDDETIAYLISGEKDLVKECHIGKDEFSYLQPQMKCIFNLYMDKCGI